MLEIDKCYVVGFEGNLPEAKTAVSWGTAAVRVGNYVLNPVTRVMIDIPSFILLSERQVLTKLPKNIKLDKSCSDYPLVVLVVNVNSKYFELFTVKDTDEKILNTTISTEYQIVIFKSLGAFDSFCTTKLQKIIKLLKNSNTTKENCNTLTNIGLTLDYRHPFFKIEV